MRGPVIAAVLGIAGCGGALASSGRAPDPRGGAAICGDGDVLATYAEGAQLARVGSAALSELSGIAASRAQRDVLWAHNDSGDGARVFAIDARSGGLRGEWVLEGAPAHDWEDIALEPVEGGPDRLWIGDVGDNAARNRSGRAREEVVVLRIDEPQVPPPGQSAPRGVAGFETIVLRYPDHAHDAEAIAIDPVRGDLYLFAKETVGVSDVYLVRAPIEAGEERTLERVASLELGSMVTGADISPDARALLVRTYRSISWWARGAGESWPVALARPARELPVAPEPQGEAIAFAADGSGYFTISEGPHPPIWFYARRCR